MGQNIFYLFYFYQIKLGHKVLKDRAVLGKSGHPSLKGNTNCETTKEKAKGLYTKFFLM